MKVYAVNTAQPSYLRTNGGQNKTKINQNRTRQTALPQDNVAFKGAKGGALGILIGGTVGALAAAAIIATGGLAGVVAAVGYTGAVGCGAASCTHIGGIAGSLIEDHNNKKN